MGWSANLPADEEERLIARQRPQESRGKHQAAVDGALMGEKPRHDRDRLAFEQGAEEDDQRPVGGDEGFGERQGKGSGGLRGRARMRPPARGRPESESAYPQ